MPPPAYLPNPERELIQAQKKAESCSSHWDPVFFQKVSYLLRQSQKGEEVKTLREALMARKLSKMSSMKQQQLANANDGDGEVELWRRRIDNCELKVKKQQRGMQQQMLTLYRAVHERQRYIETIKGWQHRNATTGWIIPPEMLAAFESSRRDADQRVHYIQMQHEQLIGHYQSHLKNMQDILHYMPITMAQDKSSNQRSNNGDQGYHSRVPSPEPDRTNVKQRRWGEKEGYDSVLSVEEALREIGPGPIADNNDGLSMETMCVMKFAAAWGVNSILYRV